MSKGDSPVWMSVPGALGVGSPGARVPDGQEQRGGVAGALTTGQSLQPCLFTLRWSHILCLNSLLALRTSVLGTRQLPHSRELPVLTPSSEGLESGSVSRIDPFPHNLLFGCGVFSQQLKP